MPELRNVYGERRLKSIPITASLLARMLTQDETTTGFRCIDGVPADAQLLDVQAVRAYGSLTWTLCFVYEHPSWAVVATGAPIPEQQVWVEQVKAPTPPLPDDLYWVDLGGYHGNAGMAILDDPTQREHREQRHDHEHEHLRADGTFYTHQHAHAAPDDAHTHAHRIISRTAPEDASEGDTWEATT